MVGVGLFYREGYFRQMLDRDGWQREDNPALDLTELPLSLAPTPDGGPPSVALELGNRTVQLLIRLARVGRVPLYSWTPTFPRTIPRIAR